MKHYVYRCYDADGRLLYIGCTGDPSRRIEAHRVSTWWGYQIADVTTDEYPDRPTALSHERKAIADESPRWNVVGRWAHRAGWSAEDYRDYYRANLMTPTQDTPPRRKHLERIRYEAADLFGIELGTREAVA